MPVVHLFGDALRVPVTVWNTPHASAFAEARLGVARDVDTFVWLYVGPGVGSAMVQDGALVTGTRGFAGEIGHCRVADRRTSLSLRQVRLPRDVHVGGRHRRCRP